MQWWRILTFTFDCFLQAARKSQNVFVYEWLYLQNVKNNDELSDDVTAIFWAVRLILVS